MKIDYGIFLILDVRTTGVVCAALEGETARGGPVAIETVNRIQVA